MSKRIKYVEKLSSKRGGYITQHRPDFSMYDSMASSDRDFFGVSEDYYSLEEEEDPFSSEEEFNSECDFTSDYYRTLQISNMKNKMNKKKKNFQLKGEGEKKTLKGEEESKGKQEQWKESSGREEGEQKLGEHRDKKKPQLFKNKNSDKKLPLWDDASFQKWYSMEKTIGT